MIKFNRKMFIIELVLLFSIPFPYYNFNKFIFLFSRQQKIGDQSCIPPLEPNVYVFQINEQDEDLHQEPPAPTPEHDIGSKAGPSRTREKSGEAGETGSETPLVGAEKIKVKPESMEAEEIKSFLRDDGSQTGQLADDATTTEEQNDPSTEDDKSVAELIPSDSKLESTGSEMCTLSTPSGADEKEKSSSVVSSAELQLNRECEPTITSSLFFTPNDLTALLDKTEIGQSILRNSMKGSLSKESKKELSTIIASNHILHYPENNVCRLSRAVLENYVNCINLRFPAEIEDTVR